jgi:hypothetical protein
MADMKHCTASPINDSDFVAINFDVLNSYFGMNKEFINLCYYFSCKIFALDHW